MTPTLASLLQTLRGRLSRRQMRLIACACVRRQLPVLRSTDEVVTLAERFADGKATAHELASARFGGRFRPGHPAWAVCWAPSEEPWARMERSMTWIVGAAGMPTSTFRQELKAQAEVMVEIAGNLLEPAPFDPFWVSWGDGIVAKMAQTIYDERDFAQMPILGDALEDAGCADGRILGHCRDQTTHYRGCWLLDLLLGRS